ncbi:hypothetical protein GCM10007164_09590 [Luteimonas padinae]|nr:hypothetical protein GCM10007164_09590 [Luteimonas padinae]
MCASVMVTMPRSGQPKACCRVTNSSSELRPIITSGMTIGAEFIRLSSPRPGNFPKRDSASPQAVPRNTAAVAVSAAIRKLRCTASSSCWFSSSAVYQRVENPPQTVATREALNEYTTTDRIGM